MHLITLCDLRLRIRKSGRIWPVRRIDQKRTRMEKFFWIEFLNGYLWNGSPTSVAVGLRREQSFGFRAEVVVFRAV